MHLTRGFFHSFSEVCSNKSCFFVDSFKHVRIFSRFGEGENAGAGAGRLGACRSPSNAFSIFLHVPFVFVDWHMRKVEREGTWARIRSSSVPGSRSLVCGATLKRPTKDDAGRRRRGLLCDILSFMQLCRYMSTLFKFMTHRRVSSHHIVCWRHGVATVAVTAAVLAVVP